MTNKSEFRYEVQYKFSGSRDLVDAWLKNNCLGAYQVRINSMPTPRKRYGDLVVAFEQESDRSAFRDQVLKDTEA